MKFSRSISDDYMPPVTNGRIAVDKEFAVKKLLKQEPIRHQLGTNGEYEVRTTAEINGTSLRASCLVYRNGIAIKKLPPLYTDYSQQIRHLKKPLEALKAEFAGQAAAAHFNRCITVIDYIASQDRSSRLRLNLLIFGLLSALFLLLAFTGYRFLSTEKKSPTAGPGTIKWETFSYKCNPAEWCSLSLPRSVRWSKTSALEIKADAQSKLPDWLTFDPNDLCFEGFVPADEPDGTYAFRIRIMNRIADRRLIQIKLKVEGNSPPRPMPPAANVLKGSSSGSVDPEELLKKLNGNGRN